MDYIGSKTKLNEWIFQYINSITPQKSTFIDGCAGSCAVTRYAANLGYNVISNDIMSFPKSLANGSIGLSENEKTQVKNIINILNSLNGFNGFFYKNYAIDSQYFSIDNARKIDAIRIEIEKENNEKIKDALLYCSLEALSKVSNTAGTHGAYLKSLKERATQDINIKFEPQINGNISAYSKDIFSLLKVESGDILYIDPPYNSRQYPNNYHLYETFTRYDHPILKGKTRIRANWQKEAKSKFCIKGECLSFLNEIIESAKVNHIFISYSSDGILVKDEITNNFNAKYEQRLQKRYKADKSDSREYDKSDLYEYIFHIKK